jgi:N-acetylneuraminic acid mutarotase
MKKQTNSTIKAHPIRGAFYLLLLVAGCAIPFALAQRNSASGPAQATRLSGGTSTPTPTCTPGGGTPGPWTQGASVAVDHYGGFMDSDGTYGYEGGGYSLSIGDNINTFARFDPGANTWTALAPVPDLYSALASGVFTPNVNKLFVFGGYKVNYPNKVVGTTRIYDIATDTWSTAGPMPDARAFMASGYFNGKIYLVGGLGRPNASPWHGQVWEYDPVTNTFNTSRTYMPDPLGGAGFGVINGHLYVAGGRDIFNFNLNTLYDYDIAADTWTVRANLPAGVYLPGSAVIGGKLWVFGGLMPETTNILQVYDPVTDTWTLGPSLNQVLSSPAGTDLANVAVAVGGVTSGVVTTDSVEVNITSGGCPSPTPTVAATATFTPTATASAAATLTPTPTATATPTSSARPRPTPRLQPTPRSRPTPAPRP